jgi:phage terminase large subunit-like protein
VPWKPPEPGAVPSLGYEVIDWIAEFLAAPDRGEYEPFVLYPEQEDFVLRFYEIDPRTGRRKYRRAVLSRPRGWGKSPFLAALACVEALAPVVPAGWDAAGQPVGKPWAEIRTPLVQVAAVSETQTKNTWTPLLEMLQGPAVDEFPGLEVLDTFVNLPRGRIEPITSSARTVKGNRAVFAVLDQTEEWVRSNNGKRLAETMRINAAKIGGSTVESPNAYIPGEESVAEDSAAFWKSIREGRAKDDGLYYDHREAPPETDMAERESLILGLRHAYGDSAADAGGHVDLDVIVATIWDPGTDPQTARADFLNQITHASDAWLSQPEWAGCADPLRVVADDEPICLGFDGSRKRNRGVTDATALIGCRISDGHLFELGVWEQPDGPAGAEWQVPRVEVDAAVRQAFDRYSVVGFYADPAKWESFVASWEGEFGARLQVKASRDHPCEWWMTGGRAMLIVRATERLHNAVVDREVTHDGSFALTRHVLNARRRVGRSGIQIAKDHPDSPRKIDGAVASVLAYEARADAVAAGVTTEATRPKSKKLQRR